MSERALPDTRPALLSESGSVGLPALVAHGNERTKTRFREFFGANIRNPNTRAAYMRATGQFLTWCAQDGARQLAEITPMGVAAYIEQHPGSDATKKQHLAALRSLFDWLVLGQVIETNPAAPVRGPRVQYTKGKTPVLQAEEARDLFAHIPTGGVVSLRDRALLGVLLYSFARVSAALSMDVGDYFRVGKRRRIRLHEKGGKHHEVPAHHVVEEYLARIIHEEVAFLN